MEEAPGLLPERMFCRAGPCWCLHNFASATANVQFSAWMVCYLNCVSRETLTELLFRQLFGDWEHGKYKYFICSRVVGGQASRILRGACLLMHFHELKHVCTFGVIKCILLVFRCLLASWHNMARAPGEVPCPGLGWALPKAALDSPGDSDTSSHTVQGGRG